MKRVWGIRPTTAASAALLISISLTIAGCPGLRIAVTAVSRGAPAVAPFFKEALGLGTDVLLGGVPKLKGGTKKGAQPGLYGGSRNKTICAKDRLVQFLTDPANLRKAVEWARVLGIGVEEIEDFVAELTPVLLRNDTLVQNYNYKKGKANPFDALLEAGIAVLVDRYGKPVVKCSCGNPLGTFKHDVNRVEAKPEDGGRMWKSYDPGKIVKVEPDGPLVAVYKLVDVEESDAGLERPAGTDGAQDEPLPYDPGATETEETDTPTAEPGTPTAGPGTATAQADVPEVTGMSAQDAAQILADQGFQVAQNIEPSDSAAPGTVFGQNPAAGEQAPVGSVVTLSVASDGTTEGTPSEPGPSFPSSPSSPGDGSTGTDTSGPDAGTSIGG